MGLDCTLVDPKSKIDKDGPYESWNFSNTTTLANGNLRTIAYFPFAQYDGGFGSTIQSNRHVTVDELMTWATDLKSWINANLGEVFDTHTVSTYDADIVDSFICDIMYISHDWIVFFW